MSRRGSAPGSPLGMVAILLLVLGLGGAAVAEAFCHEEHAIDEHCGFRVSYALRFH